MGRARPLGHVPVLLEVAGRDTAENASRSLPIVLALGASARVRRHSAWHLRAPFFFAPYRRFGLDSTSAALGARGWPRMLAHELALAPPGAGAPAARDGQRAPGELRWTPASPRPSHWPWPSRSPTACTTPPTRSRRWSPRAPRRPLQAIVLASVFNLLGPLLARRRGRRHDRRHRDGARRRPPSQVIGAGLRGRGDVEPRHLAARAAVELRPRAGRRARRRRRSSRAACDAVNWGGLRRLASGRRLRHADRARGLAAARARVAALLVDPRRCAGSRAARHAALARRRSAAGEWAMSAALAFSHGANDAQKSVGVIAALLLADGRHRHAGGARPGSKLACAAALTAGTALGRMADHSHRGPAHLPHPADRGPGQPDRVGRRDLRRLARSARRCPPLRSSPPRWSASASGAGAGTTSTGRSCARWAWRG